jgi:uncharacterized membrane protein YkvI
MIVIYLSLLIAVLGAVVYFASANPKLQEIGRLSYWVGLLVFLFHVATGAAVLAK